MKQFLISLILLTFAGTPAFAQVSAQATFDEANTLLEEGEISEAFQLYKTIEASGQVSGALYLNLGITAVHIDSLGLAKYYFLKAKEFKTTREEAASALEYVNSQFSRQSAVLPKLPWDRAVQWLNEVPTSAGVFVTGFLITLCGLILLYLGWLEKLNVEKITTFILTLFIAGTSVAGLAFYADYVDQRYDEAVLIINSQRVLQAPNPESPLVSIAYEGYDLTVDHWKSSEQEKWYYVRLSNGQFGWIQQNGVKIL